MERKIQRRTILISAIPAANTGTFTANINCEFEPTEMRVKQICQSDDQSLDLTYVVWCDTLANGPLGTFIDPSVAFPGITYNIGRPIAGTHTLRVTTTGGEPAGAMGGVLNIILQFRKYN